MIWIERFYYLHNQAANRKASQRVTLLTHPPTQQCKVKFSLSHPLFGHPLNFPMFLLTLFLSIFKDSFAAIARAKSKISANSQGNHVNNIGQLVELGDHLPLPPPLLLLLHQGPRLAGPAFAFESWNRSEKLWQMRAEFEKLIKTIPKLGSLSVRWHSLKFPIPAKF